MKTDKRYILVNSLLFMRRRATKTDKRYILVNSLLFMRRRATKSDKRYLLVNSLQTIPIASCTWILDSSKTGYKYAAFYGEYI